MFNSDPIQLLAAAIRRDHAFWIVVVLLLAIGFYLTYWAYQKRPATWRKFARRHGLSFRMNGAQPIVYGEVGGRHFELKTADRSSDRGLFGIQEVEMRLQLKTGVAVGFDLTNEGVLFTALREAVGDDKVVHLRTGEFDQRTCLHTDQESEVSEFLAEKRRTAILRLFDECRACDVHVTESALLVRERTMVKSIEALEDQLHVMMRAAKEIEPMPARAGR